MAIKITFANFKGGSGKTISTIAVASILADRNYKVLVVDCDRQGWLSGKLKADSDARNFCDIFIEDCDAEEYIQSVEYVDIIPCDERLHDIERKIPQGPESHLCIKKALDHIEDDYDFILFDTEPHENIFFKNVIMAADGVLIPFGESGDRIIIRELCEAIEEYQRYNRDLHILGAFGVVDFYRTKQYKEIIDEISKSVPVLNSCIVLDIESLSFLDSGNRILSGADETVIEREYNKLVDEIIDIIN